MLIYKVREDKTGKGSGSEDDCKEGPSFEKLKEIPGFEISDGDSEE